MDTDVEWEIENNAESQFSFQQEMYGFDNSGMTVTVDGFRIIGQPSIVPKRLKVIDTVEKTNCTGVAQAANFPQYSESHTESFSVTFGGRISWGTQVSGSMQFPGGLTVGSSQSQSIDLTASTTHSTSNSKNLTQPGSPVVLPPCKHVRATREIWVTEMSGTVAVDVRIKGNVSYSVDIDMWPDPEYDMDLNFVTTIYGTFTGVGGHVIRGVYQESPALGCAPPCRVQTANAAMLNIGKPQVAFASHVATDLGFRSKIALEGIAGAILEEPFEFEENPERPLIVNVAMIPDIQGFDEITGTSTMRIPLVGIAGFRKLLIPVTCHVPGEILGLEVDFVAVTVIQPIRIEMLEA